MFFAKLGFCFMKLLNVAVFKNIFEPRKIGVLLTKITSKFKKEEISDEYKKWLIDNAEDLSDLCSVISKDIWEEAAVFDKQLQEIGQEAVGKIPYKMGGAGASRFLFFLCRLKKPNTVVETGVALGYSSTAFLQAMRENGSGKLYSSDFPYPGIPDSHNYIGILVPDDLRENWMLFKDGDENNLPKINELISTVDILHYDSDKSREGRDRALNILAKKLTPETLIIFDDIHENSHFYNFVTDNELTEWKVFDFKNKYIGFVGGL